MILGGFDSGISEETARDFLAYAKPRGLDQQLLQVATVNRTIIAAALPILSSGRTALLFTSRPVHSDSEAGENVSVIPMLIEAVCAATVGLDIQLIQSLVDPSQETLQEDYLSCGFRTMAELIYLQALIRQSKPAPILPVNCYWEFYSQQNHDLFAAAILASYENSLDCPALNGVRSITDIIEGHKACGIFNPNHWMLLREKFETANGWETRTLAVLLLTSSGHNSELMELVYLGVPAFARGRKIGDICMAQAFHLTSETNHRILSLAVDAKNIPALRLYYRHGMARVATKLAMMRDLTGESLG
jgi:mycothiol synthase